MESEADIYAGRGVRTMTFTNDIRCSDGNMQLVIVDQELIKSYIVYHMKGYDSLGDIDIKRRYSEFEMLREALFKRYPGIFIPPIPPKQATGNKKELFVEERRYCLNRFIQKICKTSYLAKTPELQIFAPSRQSCRRL